MATTKAFAAFDPKSPLRAHPIERREPRAHDVEIEILFCGVCHTDIHQTRNDWGGAKYPMVPGHEIVGRVTSVGPAVTAFKRGDTVGVGCMVDSCRTCHSCSKHLEQYCEKGMTATYNSADRVDGSPTYGGYSRAVVVDEAFVLRVAADQPLAAVAPLLCAGITTYSPLHHWKVGKGTKVGVVGLGGLGHMAVKLAAAMGAEVTLLSTSASKREDAKRLGAHEFVVSSDAAAVGKLRGHFDFIIDTVSATHDVNPLLAALRLEGAMVLVGAPEKPMPVSSFSLIGGRKTLAGSLIGGIAETQEMLDFCAKHKVTADIEQIPIQKINEAYERMLKSDVRYRFVIDNASLA